MSPKISHPNLVVPQSKALKGLFTKLRDVNTNCQDFTFYAKRAMRILAEEAIAELPSKEKTINTPIGPYNGVLIEVEKVCAVSIIRSGDALLESVRECLPSVAVGKILIQRNEASKEKEPIFYYSKMPPGVEDMHILLCDPMLATGGSAKAAIDCMIEKYNIKKDRIIFANMITCPEGLQAMAESYPEAKIVTACIDEGLNEDKYIVPGLGDYGDRFFNTM